MMHAQAKVPPKSWLAFDLNVLSRLKFESGALPYSDNPALGAYLKRWNVRVLANDPLPSLATRLAAHVANGGKSLSSDDIDKILEDVYVPGYRLQNPSLTDWFSETDAWWFDNVFRNIQTLEHSASRALASALVLATGDYVFSFTRDTRELRQPLSKTFRRLWSTQAQPFDNGQTNICTNRNPDDFISEATADLMFMRLPHAHASGFKNYLGRFAWREEILAALHGGKNGFAEAPMFGMN
jgi:hypothetical protein